MRVYFYMVHSNLQFFIHIYLIIGFSEICKELQQIQALLLEDYLEKLCKPEKKVCYQKVEEAESA